jgi:hypothetical protein
MGYALPISNTAARNRKCACLSGVPCHRCSIGVVDRWLVPSSTSGAILGIEIDTRQLVLTDENFHIVERYDATLNNTRVCDLTWSPDERFAICRQFDDQPPEPWVQPWNGFRIDLKTGARRNLKGEYRSERWIFTGRGATTSQTFPQFTPVPTATFSWSAFPKLPLALKV